MPRRLRPPGPKPPRPCWPCGREAEREGAGPQPAGPWPCERRAPCGPQHSSFVVWMLSEPCHVLSFFIVLVLTGRSTIYRKASFPIVKCPQTRARVRCVHRAPARPNATGLNALPRSTTRTPAQREMLELTRPETRPSGWAHDGTAWVPPTGSTQPATILGSSVAGGPPDEYPKDHGRGRHGAHPTGHHRSAHHGAGTFRRAPPDHHRGALRGHHRAQSDGARRPSASTAAGRSSGRCRADRRLRARRTP